MRNQQATSLIFELSRPGRRAVQLPDCDVPPRCIEELLPPDALAASPPPLPELTEPDLVRHFVNLSTLNMSVDTHFYPLGSCTMKYNPKRNERLAGLSGLADLHPYQPESTLQGLLAILHAVQEMLAEISGLEAVSLQPAAGAHGEMTALLVAAAYFRDLGERRRTVLIPDAAHGTNPASATLAGWDAVEIKSCARGVVDLEDLSRKLDSRVAVLMMTNPNTLGLFDDQIAEIARRVHAVGGLVYLDGANMNAILGIARPGDFGADMMHFNPHKTFSGPHGGGGPGAGPIAVTGKLAPYLPVPIVVRADDVGKGADDVGKEKEGAGHRAGAVGSETQAARRVEYRLDYDRPKSIGRVRSFFGNTGVLVRTYCYLRTLGPEGLRRVAENAVLNANYLLHRVRQVVEVPYGDRCMHEFVASAARLKARQGISAMDIAKRLLDYGFHAPTVYFPLIVKEALMMEPTETESKATLDAMAEAIEQICREPTELLHEAPHSTAISRPDEVRAARTPVLTYS